MDEPKHATTGFVAILAEHVPGPGHRVDPEQTDDPGAHEDVRGPLAASGWVGVNRLTERQFRREEREGCEARNLVDLFALQVRVAVLDRRRVKRLWIGLVERRRVERERHRGNGVNSLAAARRPRNAPYLG